MDIKHQIVALESRMEHVRDESNRMDGMLAAACDQITILQQRLSLAEDKIEIMAEKVYPTFYKVFPGMAAAEKALEKAVKEAGKSPKSGA